jgi:hypothetical protein
MSVCNAVVDHHIQDEEKSDEMLKNIEQEIECPRCKDIMTSDFKKVWRLIGISRGLHAISDIYYTKGDLDQALDFLNQSLSITGILMIFKVWRERYTISQILN